METEFELSVMKSLIPLVLLTLAGLGLGSLYFGGLWATLRRIPHCRYPFFRMGVSLVGRLAVLLGGGAWLLHTTVPHTSVPPLLAILGLSAGLWFSRTLLIMRLIRMVERTSRDSNHPYSYQGTSQDFQTTPQISRAGQ
ncbi:MAG: ATP synthase subunit I [Elainellaceae cyanobacterium]